MERPIRGIGQPVRPFLRAVIEMIAWRLIGRFSIEVEQTDPRYAGGYFEAGGRRLRILIVPAETEVAILDRRAA